jgi:hypothetical protein
VFTRDGFANDVTESKAKNKHHTGKTKEEKSRSVFEREDKTSSSGEQSTTDENWSRGTVY